MSSLEDAARSGEPLLTIPLGWLLVVAAVALGIVSIILLATWG